MISFFDIFTFFFQTQDDRDQPNCQQEYKFDLGKFPTCPTSNEGRRIRSQNNIFVKICIKTIRISVFPNFYSLQIFR